jgi:neutral/alkaline ceramidase-like enzyme
MRKAFCVLIAAWAFACSAATSRTRQMEGIGVLAGVASADITPDEPIRLTGYGNRTTRASEIRQRLFAKAIAFSDGRRPSVLIAVDLIGMTRGVADEVGARLLKSGVRRDDLAIVATHTHTGPMFGGILPAIFGAPIPEDDLAVSERYTRQLVDRLERVATSALADLRPARLAWGQGRATFAANRRVLKDGKWTAFGVTPGGAVDHDLPVLAVRAPDGTLRAVVASYACHATTLEGKDNFVHGDWPGVAKELIETRHPGATALIAIGTGADANPNPRGGGLPDVERHAREIAAEIDRVLAGPLRPIHEAPSGRFRTIDLAFAAGERSTPYPVQAWTFGADLAMVFLGGEVVADYGLRLKRELDASRLWVNAYSNDVAFYVPSRRMIPEGGYEVDRSMVYYGQPGPLAEDTEERIVAAVRELLPAYRRR